MLFKLRSNEKSRRNNRLLDLFTPNRSGRIVLTILFLIFSNMSFTQVQRVSKKSVIWCFELDNDIFFK